MLMFAQQNSIHLAFRLFISFIFVVEIQTMTYIVSGIFLTRLFLNQMLFLFFSHHRSKCSFCLAYLGSKSAEKTFNLYTFILADGAASIWAQHMHIG